MSKHTRFDKYCSVCGTHYLYCGQCKDYELLPKWMDSYDSENCKDLYNVCAGFVNKWLSDEQEIARLKSLDLSYVDKLPQWMQDAIKEMQKIDEQSAAKLVVQSALEADVTEVVTTKDEVVKQDEQNELPTVYDHTVTEADVAEEEPPKTTTTFAKYEPKNKSNTKSNKSKYYTKK